MLTIQSIIDIVDPILCDLCKKQFRGNIRSSIKDKDIYAYIKNTLTVEELIIDGYIHIKLFEKKDYFYVTLICPICGSSLVTKKTKKTKKNPVSYWIAICPHTLFEKEYLCIRLLSEGYQIFISQNEDMKEYQEKTHNLELRKKEYINIFKKHKELDIKHFKSEVNYIVNRKQINQ